MNPSREGLEIYPDVNVNVSQKYTSYSIVQFNRHKVCITYYYYDSANHR